MDTDTITVPGTIILEGVTGSQAYGLATPESDVDLKGIYVAPTRDILSLFPPKDTINRTAPDVTYHEVGKFIRLAMAANPTILEILFLERYEKASDWAYWLIDNRQMFLSNRVKESYGGYAMSQIKRLERRGDGSFSSDTKKRKAKHARHCFRLLQQGKQLLATGELTVKVDNPEELFALADMSDNQLVARFEEAYAEFMLTESVLAAQPDVEHIDRILSRIRSAFYDRH